MIPEEQVLSQRVHEYLAAAFHKKGGPLTFSEWMAGALYAPNLGYYHNAKIKFGAQGDFMTAPNFSPLFGECLAEQLQAILSQLPTANILEIGPGNGSLAKTLITSLAALGQSVDTYYLLETSPSLQHSQRQCLQPLCEQIATDCQWIAEIPENFVGVILANEVIDALPAERFYLADPQTQAYQGVTLRDNTWHWEKLPVPSHQEAQLARLIRDNPDCLRQTPYISEYRPELSQWLTPLYQRLQQGVILFIDYGYHAAEYYHPARDQGTLCCFYHHQRHDNPFWMPGIQDISVHVDFSAVAALAKAANLEILGFCTQANFLINLQILDKFNPKTDSQEALQKLLHPVEMGEVVKVLALGKNWLHALQGFQGRQSQL